MEDINVLRMPSNAWQQYLANTNLTSVLGPCKKATGDVVANRVCADGRWDNYCRIIIFQCRF